MCEFELPSGRCAVTCDCCRQSAQFDYLGCASRGLGFTLFDYSMFTSFVTGMPYSRPSPPEYDWACDTYLECPF